MDAKIVEARITAMPKAFFDPMPKVMVKLEGETEERELFEFYPDEISFNPSEFIGLTMAEGRNLKFKKDRDYLRG
jgi:hypothetical protein